PAGYQARAKLHQRLARELFDRHIIATTPTTTTTVPPTTAPPATVPPAPTDPSPSTTTAP
ncbi:MAG: hypothetical protein ACKO8F_00660, partial [Acidimicrobiaceae bacterium]